MTDAARPPDPDPAPPDEEPGAGALPPEDEEPDLVGTLFVVMVFIIMTAGMWSAVYFMLLGR